MPPWLRAGTGWRLPARSGLWFLVGVSLALHLALLARGLYVGDLQGFLVIANQVGLHGPQSLYDPPELRAFRDSYSIPPIIPFLLAASFWIAGAARTLASLGSSSGAATSPSVRW